MASDHHSMAAEEARGRPVRCAVLTISDTRTRETDTGGALVCEILQSHGHEVVERKIVRDEPEEIEATIRAWIERADIHAVLSTGGTGISRRDSTIEVVRRLLTVELDGFGELFRMLSWKEVGSAAMLSRAVGGLVVRPSEDGADTLVFAMPGSLNAAETATAKLLAPELAHLVWERKR